MSFFSKAHELGAKMGHSVYSLGKKALASGISLGHKVKSIATHPVAQGIYDLLPSAVQAPIKAGLKIGEQVLNNAEALQSAINAGEDMYNKVKNSRSRGIELAKNSTVKAPNEMAPPKVDAGDERIPQRMTTGGRQGPVIGYNRPGVRMGAYEAPY